MMPHRTNYISPPSEFYYCTFSSSVPAGQYGVSKYAPVKDVFLCPDNPLRVFSTVINTKYGINSIGGTNHTFAPVQISYNAAANWPLKKRDTVTRPAWTIAFFDIIAWSNDPEISDWDGSTTARVEYWHNEAANLAIADGHVADVRVSDVLDIRSFTKGHYTFLTRN